MDTKLLLLSSRRFTMLRAPRGFCWTAFSLLGALSGCEKFTCEDYATCPVAADGGSGRFDGDFPSSGTSTSPGSKTESTNTAGAGNESNPTREESTTGAKRPALLGQRVNQAKMVLQHRR